MSGRRKQLHPAKVRDIIEALNKLGFSRGIPRASPPAKARGWKLKS